MSGIQQAAASSLQVVTSGGGGGNVTGSITILSSPTSPTPIPWNLNPVPAGGNGPLTMNVAGGVYVIRADEAANVTLKMWGGGGGGSKSTVPQPTGTVSLGSPGGGGGFAGGTWSLVNGEIYTCVVGAGGSAGSGPIRGGGGGGGASGIEIGNLPSSYGANVNSIIAVAGGGGGAGTRQLPGTPPLPVSYQPIGGVNGAFIGGGGGGATAGSGSIGGYVTPPGAAISGVYWGGGGFWSGAGTTSGGVTSTTQPAPVTPVVGPAGPTYFRPDGPPLQNWGGYARTGNTHVPGASGGLGWARGGSGSYNNYPSPGPTFYGSGGGGGGFRGGGGGGKWISPTTPPPGAPNNVGGAGGGGGSGYYNSANISGGSTSTGSGGPNVSPPAPNERPAANTADPDYSPVSLWGKGGTGGFSAPAALNGNPGVIIISLP